MKVVLLEDELMLQSAIKESLVDTGYEVTVFEDGKEAYTNIHDNSYDLFIFDINTPSIDGLSLLYNLQKEKIHVPTIFISAITEIEQISKAYELGCYDYLKKPFHLKELGLHIERLLKIADIRAKNFTRISKLYSYDTENKSLLFNGEEQLLTHKQAQIIELFAVNINKVVDFENALQDYMRANQADLLDKINEAGDYNDEIGDALHSAVKNFIANSSW